MRKRILLLINNHSQDKLVKNEALKEKQSKGYKKQTLTLASSKEEVETLQDKLLGV
jgi:superfamily II helicase